MTSCSPPLPLVIPLSTLGNSSADSSTASHDPIELFYDKFVSSPSLAVQVKNKSNNELAVRYNNRIGKLVVSADGDCAVGGADSVLMPSAAYKVEFAVAAGKLPDIYLRGNSDKKKQKHQTKTEVIAWAELGGAGRVRKERSG